MSSIQVRRERSEDLSDLKRHQETLGPTFLYPLLKLNFNLRSKRENLSEMLLLQETFICHLDRRIPTQLMSIKMRFQYKNVLKSHFFKPGWNPMIQTVP